MELTQEYLDQALKDLVRKKDLEKLATKTEVAHIQTDITAVKQNLYLMATAEEQKQIFQTVEATKTSNDSNTTTLDGIAKGMQDLRTEKIARQSQLDRHAMWIKAIADHIGMKLEN